MAEIGGAKVSDLEILKNQNLQIADFGTTYLRRQSTDF